MAEQNSVKLIGISQSSGEIPSGLSKYKTSFPSLIISEQDEKIQLLDFHKQQPPPWTLGGSLPGPGILPRSFKVMSRPPSGCLLQFQLHEGDVQ